MTNCLGVRGNVLLKGDDAPAPVSPLSCKSSRRHAAAAFTEGARPDFALLSYLAITAMAATAQKLLVIGLCGEIIPVDWHDGDTVKHIKEQAYAAASAVPSAVGGHLCNLVKGVSCDQLSLVFGQPNDAVKLADESAIQDCLGAHWR